MEGKGGRDGVALHHQPQGKSAEGGEWRDGTLEIVPAGQTAKVLLPQPQPRLPFSPPLPKQDRLQALPPVRPPAPPPPAPKGKVVEGGGVAEGGIRAAAEGGGAVRGVEGAVGGVEAGVRESGAWSEDY